MTPQVLVSNAIPLLKETRLPGKVRDSQQMNWSILHTGQEPGLDAKRKLEKRFEEKEDICISFKYLPIPFS